MHKNPVWCRFISISYPCEWTQDTTFSFKTSLTFLALFSRVLSRAHLRRPMKMDQQKINPWDIVVKLMLLVLLFCVGYLYWTNSLPFTLDFILNHIDFTLRYTHELATSYCHCAPQYILKRLETIFRYCLQGVKVVMPSARGRRVRIVDEVSSSFMAYYDIRVDEIILCRSST